MILHVTLTAMHIWEKKINATQIESIYKLWEKKEGKKIIQKTSYTKMKSMKDGNKIKAKLIFIENLSHTILEVQEKE